VNRARNTHLWQIAQKLFHDVILSEAKNLVFNRVKNLRDASSPTAPQNDRSESRATYRKADHPFIPS
jgi:hypothetical protein